MTKPVEISQIEIENQKAIMSRIAEINKGTGKMPLAFVDTYGCQQNEADSEKFRGMLSEMGYGFTRNEEEADVFVINTCAVREHAEKRILGNVGALSHLKAKDPNRIIALCGCMVQQEHMAEKIKKSFRHVDLVLSPKALWRFPEYMERLLSQRGRIFAVDGEGLYDAIAEGLPVQKDGNIKAWLSVMYGCNNFCSYCIVPYVRGRERSRRPELILEEARGLAKEGFRDITLLGQNVNSYGRDLDTGMDFAGLIREINAIEGDFLIRFMTSHPKDATERLFETMASCTKAARHIHLPFQAGNNRILKAMNRGYTKEEYLELIAKARGYMPDIVLTSDVIAGFPGETDEEFEDTLEVIEKVRFDALFTFIYSKRGGTPAAELPDPYTKADKQRRFERMIALQNGISAEKHKSYWGSTQRVLVDGTTEDPRHNLTARTNGGRLVHLTGDASLVGEFADVRITGGNTWSLEGQITVNR